MKKSVKYQQYILLIAALLAICINLTLFKLSLPNKKTYGLLTIVVLALASFLANYLVERNFRNKIFKHCSDLTEDEIYCFFNEMGFTKDKVLELWKEVAITLHVPITKLRPTDKFGEEIGGYGLIDDDLDQLYYIAKSRLKNRKSNFDFNKVRTVSDYVIYFAKLSNEQSN